MTEALTIDDAKAALRRQASKRRSAIAEADRSAAAQDLAAQDLGFLGERRGLVVSGYHPLGDELDVRPLMERLAGEGHPLVLPVTPKGRARLTFRAWAPGERLVEGLFGVREPEETAAVKEPAILLVPLLAFDSSGHRLGYGAGYYDRTLADLRAKGPVTAVAVAFAAQEVAAIPHDAYDQRLDWILTPEGVRRAEG